MSAGGKNMPLKHEIRNISITFKIISLYNVYEKCVDKMVMSKLFKLVGVADVSQ